MEDEIIALAEDMNFMTHQQDNTTTLRMGCMGLALVLERVDDDHIFPYLHCRKPPGAWSGGASDIIDITTYLAAAFMYGRGKASYQLLDHEHPAVSWELGERFLVPRQPMNLTIRRDLASMENAVMDLWSFGAFVHTNLPDYCPDRAEGETLAHQSAEVEEWARQVASALPEKFDVSKDLYTARDSPRNFYYRSADGETSITRDADVVSALRMFVEEAETIAGHEGEIRHIEDLQNAVSYKDLDTAVRILRAAGERVDEREDLTVFPFENAILCAGNETIALLASSGGRQAYQEQRERIIDQYRVISSTLLAPDSFTWSPKIDGQEFEDLVRELLEADPFVLQVRSAGPARERDGGKDLLIKQLVPGVRNARWDADDSNLQEIPVVVQCKAMASTVGVSDVREIRDVIEDAGAQGFLLVTSSRVSSALTSRLDAIRDKNGFHTDWWDRHQLEVLLRRNPHIVRRYPSIVQPHIDGT
ncbi:restriction endonuclease [Streptomyces sp. NPDC059161]|uniref:restriction endonuclease n=1 Tax=Streptomyces sp. NPDC059161 TaxID=3346749 RepID=UPI0036B7EBCD